jgi:uncharacterized membrane protein YeaQ/YmgE (transglycosylase-associated protein family)
MDLIIQLILGAIGGNAAGAGAKDLSMGTLWNSVSGAVGGAGLTALVPALAGAVGGGQLGGAVSGGIGGIVLTLVAGFIKSKMGAKAA